MRMVRLFLSMVVVVMFYVIYVHSEQESDWIKMIKRSPEVRNIESSLFANSSNLITRIVGGTNVVAGEFGHHVVVYSTDSAGNKLFCGGSAIRRNWILTAGHCVSGMKSSLVIAGMINLKDANIWRLTNITKANLFPHPDFNNNGGSENDIGLIKLRTPLPLSARVNLIQLPSKKSSLVGLNANVTGFGRYSDKNTALSQHLLWATFKIVGNGVCTNTYYSKNITDSQMCIETKSQRSICEADSGGSLVINKTLLGIVSYGFIKCEQNYPVIFTKVFHYLDWINMILKL